MHLIDLSFFKGNYSRKHSQNTLFFVCDREGPRNLNAVKFASWFQPRI